MLCYAIAQACPQVPKYTTGSSLCLGTKIRVEVEYIFHTDPQGLAVEERMYQFV